LSTIHKKVLDDKQSQVWPLLLEFKNLYLAGGTALALQIGHRKSIDFDLFQNKEIDSKKIIQKLDRSKIERIIVDNKDEFTLIYDGIKLTFLNYPFEISPDVNLNGVKSVDPLTIAAMKAYALGRRSKWKDYVDLYFVTQQYSLKKIIKKAKDIFGRIFSEKLFRTQLCYFEDIDYSEEVAFSQDNHVSDKEIQEVLKKIAIDL